MKPLSLVAIVLVSALPSAALAQSLADVARAEAARRRSITEPVKVYTNEDLKSDFTTPVPPPDASAAEPASEPPSNATASEAGAQPAAGADEKDKAPGPLDEAAWRTRITTARQELERLQMFAEALQSRINALTTDFVNRDDPAQRDLIAQDRQKALDELDRVTKEQAEQSKRIAAIEEEARKAGVPPAWLR